MSAASNFMNLINPDRAIRTQNRLKQIQTRPLRGLLDDMDPRSDMYHKYLNAGMTEQALGLLDPRKEQIQGLLGQRPQQYQGEMAGAPQPGQPQPSFAQQPTIEGSGTGFLGGKSTPAEFYGQLLSIPGYENIGAKGLSDSMAAPDNKKIFDHAAKLRNEFTKQSGDFIKVRDAYGRIQASVSDPSGAGDLALIFNYMKVLDPGSTVREGEFANAQNSGGVGDKVVGVYNSILNGKRLSPTQRQDFVKRANKLYGSQLESHNQLVTNYNGLANRYGVNPQNVTLDYLLKNPNPPKQQNPVEPPPNTVPYPR